LIFTLLSLALLVPAWTIAASPTAADALDPGPVARSQPRVRLASLERIVTRAPDADARAVEREVRAALYGTQSRIRQCLEGADVREDPLRARQRSLVGTLQFSRSTRPEVRVQRSHGMPSVAQDCVLEVLRSIAVRTAPRGEVQLRFRYVL
jgi:hypothetical protein